MPARLKATVKNQKRGGCGSEEGEEGEDSGCEVALRGEGGEAGGQMRADDAGNEEYQAKEAEAVQGGDGAMGFDAVDGAEAGQGVEAEGEQAGDVPEDELQLKDGVDRHSGSSSMWYGIMHIILWVQDFGWKERPGAGMVG